MDSAGPGPTDQSGLGNCDPRTHQKKRSELCSSRETCAACTRGRELRDSWRARGDKYPGLNRCTNLGRCWCQSAIPGLLRQCPFPPARRARAVLKIVQHRGYCVQLLIFSNSLARPTTSESCPATPDDRYGGPTSQQFSWLSNYLVQLLDLPR